MIKSISFSAQEYPNGFKHLNELVELVQIQGKAAGIDANISARSVASDVLFAACKEKIIKLKKEDAA